MPETVTLTVLEPMGDTDEQTVALYSPKTALGAATGATIPAKLVQVWSNFSFLIGVPLDE